MKRGPKRLDLIGQAVAQFLAHDHRNSGNVVNGLVGIKLGQLPAWPVQNVDEMALEIEEPKLKYREQPHGACTDDDGIGFDGRGRCAHVRRVITCKVMACA